MKRVECVWPGVGMDSYAEWPDPGRARRRRGVANIGADSDRYRAVAVGSWVDRPASNCRAVPVVRMLGRSSCLGQIEALARIWDRDETFTHRRTARRRHQGRSASIRRA
jgi:hypothetical protein